MINNIWPLLTIFNKKKSDHLTVTFNRSPLLSSPFLTSNLSGPATYIQRLQEQVRGEYLLTAQRFSNLYKAQFISTMECCPLVRVSTEQTTFHKLSVIHNKAAHLTSNNTATLNINSLYPVAVVCIIYKHTAFTQEIPTASSKTATQEVTGAR